MTCKEIHEQITAFVDNRVDEQEYRSKVEQHIKYCPECRAAYELELMTKMVVRDRTRRASAPDELRKAIAGGVDRIAAERRAGAPAPSREEVNRGWLDRFAAEYLTPAGVSIAVILVLVGGGLLVLAPDRGPIPIMPDEEISTIGPTASGPQNFFNKASENYRAILAGQLDLQAETDDPGELEDYFRKSGVSYDVVFRQVRVPLAGGVVSDHGTAKFAHMVYVSGDTVLYFFEVPYDALRRGNVVYVTPDRLDHLERREWIWEEPMSGRVLGMYKDGNVVYAVVGNVPRPAMEKLLTVR